MVPPPPKERRSVIIETSNCSQLELNVVGNVWEMKRNRCLSAIPLYWRGGHIIKGELLLGDINFLDIQVVLQSGRLASHGFGECLLEKRQILAI